MAGWNNGLCKFTDVSWRRESDAPKYNIGDEYVNAHGTTTIIDRTTIYNGRLDRYRDVYITSDNLNPNYSQQQYDIYGQERYNEGYSDGYGYGSIDTVRHTITSVLTTISIRAIMCIYKKSQDDKLVNMLTNYKNEKGAEVNEI